MTAADVYAELGKFVQETTPPGWVKCLLRVERQEGAQEYAGTCLAEGSQFVSLINSDTPSPLVSAVEVLYRITTQGGNNKWNLLYFTLMPGGAFEVDFIWDEDRAAALAAIARTRGVPEPEREEILLRLDEEIKTAKTTRLYRSISQHLAGLAAVLVPAWQRITLRIVRWNGATFTLNGFAQLNEMEVEEFNVTQGWNLVKEFYDLSTMALHPRWNQAEWTVRPDGTYSIMFDWNIDTNPRRPPNIIFPYTREGRWQEPG